MLRRRPAVMLHMLSEVAGVVSIRVVVVVDVVTHLSWLSHHVVVITHFPLSSRRVVVVGVVSCYHPVMSCCSRLAPASPLLARGSRRVLVRLALPVGAVVGGGGDGCGRRRRSMSLRCGDGGRAHLLMWWCCRVIGAVATAALMSVLGGGGSGRS